MKPVAKGRNVVRAHMDATRVYIDLSLLLDLLDIIDGQRKKISVLKAVKP